MNNINDNNQKLRGKKKSNYNEQMNVKDNLSENKSDIYNKEYGTDNSYRKPYQNQYKKGISTGEDALNTLKDIIRQRGSRGILGMRRCFMIYDEDNTRVLTFDNFYKYITNFLIPISRNDAKALFKLYDKKTLEKLIMIL
jgi:hypothetical protein